MISWDGLIDRPVGVIEDFWEVDGRCSRNPVLHTMRDNHGALSDRPIRDKPRDIGW